MDTTLAYHHQDILFDLESPIKEFARLRRILNVLFSPAQVELYQNSTHALFNARLADHTETGQDKWLASSEPSTRSQVVNLTHLFESCLDECRAKPIGLCPIRRAIYDQCFDELIRQVTVECIERGLLLFRIRNELTMTINYYRRAYESAVAYGASKSIDAQLYIDEYNQKMTEIEDSLRNIRNKNTDKNATVSEDSMPNKEDTCDLVDRTREHYQGELTKMNQIIKRQRSIIEALTQKSIDQIKSFI